MAQMVICCFTNPLRLLMFGVRTDIQKSWTLSLAFMVSQFSLTRSAAEQKLRIARNRRRGFLESSLGVQRNTSRLNHRSLLIHLMPSRNLT